MSWSYRKNLIGKVRIYYSSGCVGPVQIPLDELADELNDYEARIAELEDWAYNIFETNNGKDSPNDTQTQTIVYGKEREK